MNFKEFVSINKIIKDLQIENHFKSFVLDEIFDYKNEITIIENNKYHFNTEFTINNIKYSFMSLISDDLAVIQFFPIDKEKNLFKKRNSDNYSGKIFSMIFSSIHLLLKNKKEINKIGFTADNNFLEKLYDKMIKYIEKEFSNFKFKEKIINMVKI